MKASVLALAISAAWAQSGIEGVRSGVLFDAPSGSIRFMEGIPGAAHLGGPAAEGLEAASVSPSGRVALAKRDAAWVALRGLGTETLESIELGEEIQGVQWSGAGRYAAVALADGRVGVWDAEAMEWLLKAEAAETGELAGAAVTEEGLLLAGWFDGESTRLASWKDGAWQEMGRVRGRAAIACSVKLAVVAGEGEMAVFASGEEAWRSPMGREDAPVGLAIQGELIAAAFGGDQPELVWWKAEGGEAQRLALELTPDRLEPLAGGNGLVLKQRERAGDEIWVAVPRGEGWAAYFVPAGE